MGNSCRVEKRRSTLAYRELNIVFRGPTLLVLKHYDHLPICYYSLKKQWSQTLIKPSTPVVALCIVRGCWGYFD